jgi:hypothetical protein
VARLHICCKAKYIRTQVGQVILAGHDGLGGLPALSHVSAVALAPLASAHPTPHPRAHCFLSDVPAHAAVANLPAGVFAGTAGPTLHPAVDSKTCSSEARIWMVTLRLIRGGAYESDNIRSLHIGLLHTLKFFPVTL